MICINPPKYFLLRFIFTLICLVFISVFLILSYMNFTAKGYGYENIIFYFFGLLLFFAFFALTTLFYTYCWHLIFLLFNLQLLFMNHRKLRFKTGSYVREISKENVDYICMMNNQLLVYTKTGDLFVQLDYLKYKRVKQLCRRFGYDYKDYDTYTYTPVDASDVDDRLKSELYFRFLVDQYEKYMVSINKFESDLFLLRHGVIYRKGKDGPLVRRCTHAMFSNDAEVRMYKNGKRSFHNLVIYLLVLSLLLVNVFIYHEYIGLKFTKPFHNRDAVQLGYVIEPCLLLLSFCYAYTFTKKKNDYHIGQEGIALKKKGKPQFIYKTDIAAIESDYKAIHVTKKDGTKIAFGSDTRENLYFELLEYGYPLVVERNRKYPEYERWFPGSPSYTPIQNGWIKAYYALQNDDEAHNYNESIVQMFEKELEKRNVGFIKDDIASAIMDPV